MTHDRIEINPDIMGGKPVIRGTRVPVETILRKLGAGMTRRSWPIIRALRAKTYSRRRLSPPTIWLTKIWSTASRAHAGLVYHLRASGHDVLYMAELAPATSDADVLARADDDGRILLTEDKDFGDLVFRRGGHVPGLVLLRVDPAQHALKRERLDAAVALFGEDGLRGRYMIVEAGCFRSRPLRPG